VRKQTTFMNNVISTAGATAAGPRP